MKIALGVGAAVGVAAFLLLDRWQRRLDEAVRWAPVPGTPR